MPSHHIRYAMFGFALALGALPVASRAQDVPNGPDAVEVRTQFLSDLDTLQTKFLALANAFPAEKYSWRPGTGVRSVGEVFMHVASEFYVYNEMAYGAPTSPVVSRDQASMKKFETMSTKPDVLKHLNDSFAYCHKTLSAIDPSALTGKRKLFGGSYNIIETSFSMTDDLHEHLGQLIAYARMNGIAPPWSKGS
jgi:hypothetical protein